MVMIQKDADAELSGANANLNASITPGHGPLASALGLGRKGKRRSVLMNTAHISPSRRRTVVYPAEKHLADVPVGVLDGRVSSGECPGARAWP